MATERIDELEKKILATSTIGDAFRGVIYREATDLKAGWRYDCVDDVEVLVTFPHRRKIERQPVDASCEKGERLEWLATRSLFDSF